MPAKIKAIPLRMSDALKKRVAAWAEREDSSLHAAVVSLIELGLGDTPKALVTASVSPKRGPTTVAMAKRGAPKPTVTDVKRTSDAIKRDRWGVQFGPTAHAPGSLLKGAGRVK